MHNRAAGLTRMSEANNYVFLPKNLVTNSGTVLESFETTADWTPTNSTATTNTTNFRTGTQSVKLTPTAGITTPGMITKTINLSNLTSYNAQMRISFYVDDPSKIANVSGMRFYISSSTTPTSKCFYYSVNAPNLKTGWNTIQITSSDWTSVGSESWSNTFVRLRCQVVPYSSSVTPNVSFDNWTMGVVSQPVVVITFDDARTGVVPNAWPIMKKHGIVGTRYIPTATINQGSYPTSTDLLAMQASGWAICNHTVNHVAVTAENAVSELGGADTALTGYGLKGGKHCAYPISMPDATVLTAVASAGMLTGRYGGSSFRNVSQIESLLQIDAWGVQQTTTLDTVKGYIDDCIAKKYILVLTFHDIVTTPSQSTEWATADFTSLIEYIASQKLQSCNVIDLYNLQSGGVKVRKVR